VISGRAARAAGRQSRPGLSRRQRAGAPQTAFGLTVGSSRRPRGLTVVLPWDRSMRVVGPPGSGKTLAYFAPLVLAAPGPVLVSSTKPDIVELTWTARSQLGPCRVVDPLGVTAGLPALRWSPLAGCGDPTRAETLARAFVAGTGTGSGAGADGGASAFYREQAAAVLACLLHAAALAGADLSTWLRWCGDPTDRAPRTILAEHVGAGPGMLDKLASATTGDSRTVGNIRATVATALAWSTVPAARATLAASPDEVDRIEDLLDAGGTIYLLGKDDPTSPVVPLLTAIAEDVLDRAERHALTRPAGRLDPPLVAALDEAPLTAPIPSLPQRVGDGRGRGLSVHYGMQGWPQARARWGEQGSSVLASVTTGLLAFGGSNDPQFNSDIERLCGTRRVQRKDSAGTRRGETEPVLAAAEFRQLRTRQALLLIDRLAPVVVKTRPVFTDRARWKTLQAGQAQVRTTAAAARTASPTSPIVTAPPSGLVQTAPQVLR
jgi:type IV secretory pathway TraG/TraD family ATPase VirD4